MYGPTWSHRYWHWKNWQTLDFRFVTSVVFTTWVATGGTIYKRYQPFVSVTSPHFPKYYSLNQHCHLIGMLLKFDIMMLLQNYHDLQNMIIIKINLKISTIIVIIIKKIMIIMIIIIINPGSSTLGCPPNWVQDFESPNATSPEPTQPLPGHLGEDNVLISWWCFLYKYPSQIVSITPVGCTWLCDDDDNDDDWWW